MADYSDDGRYDEPRRYRSTRVRPRGRNEPEYVEETTFIERGKGPPPRELVPRPRERDDSVEDIRRDSPPSGHRPRAYDDYGVPPSRPSHSRGGRYNDDYDDSDDDYLPGGAAAGAAAGYAAGRRNRDRSHGRSAYRNGRDDDTVYSDGEARNSPRKREEKKSGLEEALEGFGLGGLAGTLLGKKNNRSPSRSADDARSRNHSRPRGEKKQREWAQAAQAALIAGAVEAFRARNEPGPWTGTKGRRVATAALASGGIDKLVDRDPDHKSKRHLVEAVIGGLAANRLANGPTHSSKDARGRSRSRSQSVFSRYRSKSRRRSGSEDSGGDRGRSMSTGEKLKDAGAGVVLAGVAKKLYDRFRSKSRARSSSSGSEDDRSRRRDAPAGGNYARSRDVGPDDGEMVPRGRGAAGAADLDGEGRSRGRSSSSDSLSSTDMENRRKKMRGKEFLTAGLATIATIHAAHGVYSSMEASDKRHKLVAEGEMTPEVARKKRSKAWLQDAAAVGIAALGIKGAYSEWKEMNEQRHSIKELEERRRARQKRRERRLKEAAEHGAGGPPY